MARDRLAEARQAVLVVRRQAAEATVTAPFSGSITAVNAELGQNVDNLGLFALVSDELEIRVDLDESNLADILVGQTEHLVAAAFPANPFEAELKEIPPSVNKIRGTVSIKLRPIRPPAWLGPGQTLNVNLVTNSAVQRLLVPATAVRRPGDRTVVLAVENGHAVEKIVVTRPPAGDKVPVLAGLTPSDSIVVNPVNVRAGDVVRVRK